MVESDKIWQYSRMWSFSWNLNFCDDSGVAARHYIALHNEMRPQYVGIVCQRTDVKKVVEVRNAHNMS